MDPDISMGTALAIFGMAFAAWAWVVAWGVSVVRKEVHDMKSIATSSGTALNAHINQTERRLTMLETEFQYVKRAINHQD